MHKRSFSRDELIKKMSACPLEKVYKIECSTTAKIRDIDCDDYYSEVMSNYVLSKTKQLKEIEKNNAWKIKPSAGLSYFSDYRTNITKALKEDEGKSHFKKDDEKIICREIYIRCKNGACYDGIGKVIDFETPLAHLRDADKPLYKSREVGKVDMISISHEDEPTIWLLEAKKENSDESMYRCVMEGFTYLQTIDKERFIEDLKKRDSQFESINNSIRFRTAPLIAFKGNQHKEMKEAEEKPNLHEQLIALMHLLDVTEYFSYQIDSEKIIIRKHSI